MSQPLHIKGAQVWQEDFSERDLYVKNGRIVGDKPNHAVTVDLEGYTVFPGLINAHDHLELNHFPRTKFREVYDNAHQWGEDVNARLNDEPFKTLRSYPLWDRVFIGGLKNLLCGATTVVHHGPPHKPMYHNDFPVRVLKNYGWAHSLHFSTENEIQESYLRTRQGEYWFIHLAEGTDEVAANELSNLEKIIPLSLKMVLIHGIGLKPIGDMWLPSIENLVWCPTTNHYLLNSIRNMHDDWKRIIWLGSDSRLTADGDLLDEIRFLRTQFADIPYEDILAMVMISTLGHPDAQELENLNLISIHGHYADWLAVKSDVDLTDTARSQLAAVCTAGIPQIGNPDVMAKFPHIETVACTLDGVEKRMNVELARQVHRCTLKEQGLEVDALPTGKRFIFF
jgi:hypothetical protein